MSMLEPGLEFMSSDSYMPYFLSCTITFTLSFLLSLSSFGKPVITLNSAVFFWGWTPLMDSIPGLGRPPGWRAWQATPVFLPGECIDRGVWRAAVHTVAKSWTWLRQLSTYACTPLICKQQFRLLSSKRTGTLNKSYQSVFVELTLLGIFDMLSKLWDKWYPDFKEDESVSELKFLCCCFSGDSVVSVALLVSGENSPANAGDMGWIPGSGRFPGEGNGNPLHYSCLGNPMGRGAWRATVHGHNLVTKQQ